MNSKEVYPLITVVTLTRNRANLLKRAIGTVLSQSYKNIEYIIVDGASTDNTEEVVKSFADDRIKYIKQSENILSEAQELFIKNSNGDYFAFLDDDDEYLTDKLLKEYEAIKDTDEKVGLVYCWMDYYDSSTNKLIKEYHPNLSGNVYYDQIERQSIGGTPTLLIKREAFIKSGGWNMKLKFTCDWEMLTSFSRLFDVVCLPEVLVKVNVNHGFQRQTEFSLAREKYFNIIDLHLYYLKEFSDGFSKYPHKRFSHFSSIARCYSYLNDFGNFIKFSKKAFVSGTLIDKFRSIPYFFKRLLRCLFCKKKN